MLACLPNPYPDEILYSWIARYADLLGYVDARDVKLAVLGNSRAVLSVHMPNSIAGFVNNTPTSWGMTVEDVIYNHTFHDWYVPFLDSAKANKLWEYMVGTNGARPSNFLPPLRYLRYCPHCIVEDREMYGETYWRRLFQLPSVHMCPTHQVLLENSSIAYPKERGMKTMHIAETSIQSMANYRPLDPDDPAHRIFALAVSETLWFLSQAEPSYLVKNMMDSYVKFLEKHKYGEYDDAPYGYRAKRSNRYEDFVTRIYPQLGEEFWLLWGVPSKKALFNILRYSWRYAWRPHYHLLPMILFAHNRNDRYVTETTETVLYPYTVKGRKASPYMQRKSFGHFFPCANPSCRHYKKNIALRYPFKQIYLERLGFSKSTHFIKWETKKPNEGWIITCNCGFNRYRKFFDLTLPDIDKPVQDRILTYGANWVYAFLQLWEDDDASYQFIADKLNVTKKHIEDFALMLHIHKFFSKYKYLYSVVPKEIASRLNWACRNAFCEHYQQPEKEGAYYWSSLSGCDEKEWNSCSIEYVCHCGFRYSHYVDMATMEIEQRSKMKIEFFGIRWLQGFIRLWVDATLMKEEISEQLGFTPHYLKYLLKNDLKLYKLSLWDNRTEQLACRVVSSASDNDSQLVA